MSEISKEWLTVNAYAEHVSVCAPTVRAWIKIGLPVVSIGNIVRIDRECADAWLARHSTRQKRAKRVVRNITVKKSVDTSVEVTP